MSTCAYTTAGLNRIIASAAANSANALILRWHNTVRTRGLAQAYLDALADVTGVRRRAEQIGTDDNLCAIMVPILEHGIAKLCAMQEAA